MDKYKDIISGIFAKYTNIDTSNAQGLIDELMQYEGHWSDCKTLFDYYQTYINIFYAIGLAHGILGRYKESLDILLPALEEYNKLSEYGYGKKADFYQLIGHNYCHLCNEEEARKAYKQMAYNEFKNLNRTSYAVDLYSFRTPSEYAIKDIKNSTLSFSKLTAFNDPVDSAFFKIEEERRKTITDKSELLVSRLISEAYAHFRARSLVSNVDLFKLNDIINPKTEYLCTTPEYKSTLMWGYYTDSHEGFCIKYKFQNRITPQNSEDEIMIAQMDYIQSMPYDTTLTFQKCFLTKSIKWKHEREKRLLYFNPNNTEDHPTIAIPNYALQAIYLGVKCSDETKKKIKEAIKDKPHIELYQMYISSDNVYALEAKKIDRD